MNNLIEIKPYDFSLKINDLWKNQWLLLTVGDFEKGDFNTMTVAWGSLGVMWRKPFAMVVVRPTRYTFGFINRFPDFTLSAFPGFSGRIPERPLPAGKKIGSRWR